MSAPDEIRVLRYRTERLMVDVTHPDAPRFLLEHLAEWGIDVRDLATRALAAEAGE